MMYYYFNNPDNTNKSDDYKDKGPLKGMRKGDKRASLGRFLKKFGKSFKKDTKLGRYLKKNKGKVALGAAGAILLAKKLMDDRKMMNTYQDAIMGNRSLRRKVMGVY